MVSQVELQQAIACSPDVPPELVCQRSLDLYASPQRQSLATQASPGRQLRPLANLSAGAEAIEVCLCEDDYGCWLAISDLPALALAAAPYQAVYLSPSQIQARLPAVIDFGHAAMAQPNNYLWGGTVGPHYDCSGLMQAAFAAAGIRLPRDAYQQAAFTEPVALPALLPGDLIFFGTAGRITHVGLHLGDGRYLHSSGKDQGRNGIGIDTLKAPTDPVGVAYLRQLKGAGRVTASYQPQGRPDVWPPR